MKTRIVNGVEEGLANQLRGEFISCFTLRKRIASLLQDDLDALHKSMRDEEVMSSPSWSHIQAAKVGEAKALVKLIGLLEEK